MFGYVRICKPPMTCGDYEMYQGVYCSLCRALGRRYGPLARLTLNYDMTFYALLALQGEQAEFTASRCSFNPLKKCLHCKSAAVGAAADVSMLLAYYKWRDNLRDSAWYGKLLWALPGIFFLWSGRRAKRRAPGAERIIRVAVAAQALLEAGDRKQEAGTYAPCALTPDSCSHPSAHALGALCALLDPALYRLGYLLGRWGYLMDAADDYADDLKHGRFNPFVHCGGEPQELIRATSSEIARAWEMEGEGAGIRQFRAILENILTLGLADMEQRLFKEGDVDEKSL